MSTALLLFPDLALILIGCLLRRLSGPGLPLGVSFSAEVWPGIERLVYFVLFPALLFSASLRSRLDSSSTLPMLWVSIGVVLIALVAVWLARWILKPDARDFASLQQCAFRFNTYIGLALAQRLSGDAGVAQLAIIVAFAVPLCNALAVLPLASHSGGNLFVQLLRNPLLVATGSGLIGSTLGIELPEPVMALLNRMGQAAVALGLLSVGAGLNVSGVAGSRWLIGVVTVIKVVLVPACALWFGTLVGLQADMLATVVLFAALPTASSAYILAIQMGGNGPLVAAAITVSTLSAIITLPVWLSLVR